MSSRALGEDTENIRESLGEIDLDGDYVAALSGRKCEEKKEMFQRSVVAIAMSFQSSDILMDTILAQGVNSLQIKPMGGRLHLITFASIDEKVAMLESKWLDQWFIHLGEVNNKSSGLWREAWLRIHGIPLVAWSYENFYNTGCIFGRINSVNCSDFDCGYILVTTDCLFEINCKISLDIEGIKYPVYISEKNGQWSNVPSQKKANVNSKPVQNIPSPPPPEPTSPSQVKTKETSEQSNIPHDSNVSPLCNNDCMGKSPPTKASQQKNFKIPTFSSPQSQPLKPQDTCLNSLGNVTNAHAKQLLTFNDGSGSCPHSPSLSGRNQKPNKPQNEPPYIPSTAHLKPKSPLLLPSISKPISSPDRPKLIPTFNKFGPLLRNTKSSSSSSTTLGSSSESGPLFPPGFEDNIPPQTKIAQLRKRQKKWRRRKSSNCSPYRAIRPIQISSLPKTRDISL